MTRNRLALLFGCAVLTLGSGPCGSVLKTNKPPVERRHATISPAQFTTIGTVAGAGGRFDRQIMVTVRAQLTDSGVKAVPLSGRFETERDALTQGCAPGAEPAIDGVLFVWHDRLALHDCVSQVVAYEVEGESQGITALTNRLVAYLKSGATPQPASPTPN